MGTVIKACFATSDVPAGAIDMAALAARECLHQAGLPPEEVELLIYIGVFRDDNMIEPAIAPLIQKALGVNPDPVQNGHRTFAFDINDGKQGFLTAARVADSFFQTGAAKNALIVGGDIHPSKTTPTDFPFSTVASATLLTYSQDPLKGFAGFHFQTSANGSAGLTANVDLSANATKNRERLILTRPDHYENSLLAFTASMLENLAAGGKVDFSAVDHVIVSRPGGAFRKRVLGALGLNDTVLAASLPIALSDAHTSALPLHYQHLAGTGLLKENQTILFVSAGAGLSACCCLYVV